MEQNAAHARFFWDFFGKFAAGKTYKTKCAAAKIF